MVTLQIGKPFCCLDSARACLASSQLHKFSKFVLCRIMALTIDSKPVEVNGECPCESKRYKMENNNKVTVVLGAQWGDEGKGKVVDLLAVNSDIVCRCQVINISVYY